jgi:recombination protein U
MKEFEEQKGIAFLLIYFKKQDVFYYLPFEELYKFWERGQKGGRKSFRFEELDPHYQISTHNGVFVHYLEMLRQDLENRD